MRKKVVTIFGNGISDGEMLLCYYIIQSATTYEEAIEIMSKNTHVIGENVKSIHKFNKRFVMAIQLFFGSDHSFGVKGYFPLFPEFMWFIHDTKSTKKGIIINKGINKIKFTINNISMGLDGKKRGYWNDWYKRDVRDFYCIGSDSPKIFNQARDFIKLSASVVEEWFVQISDLIINFMDTNSSSIEFGIYSDPKIFKKTVVVNTMLAVKGKTDVGEFTKQYIDELASSNQKRFNQIYINMIIDKNKYTYLNPNYFDQYLFKKISNIQFNRSKRTLRINKKDLYWRMIRVISHHIAVKYKTNRYFRKIPVYGHIDTEQKTSKSKLLSQTIINELISSFISEDKELDNLLNSFDLKKYLHKKMNRKKTKSPEQVMRIFLLCTIMVNYFFQITKFEKLNKKSSKQLLMNSYHIKGKRLVYPQNPFTEEDDRYLLNELDVNFKHSDNSFAYKKGSGVFDAIKLHKNSKYFLKIDIKDFFHSVKLVNLRHKLSNNLYDKLFTSDIWIDNKNKTSLKQGFILSPKISDIYLNEFDREIIEILNKIKKDFIYTRYSDDILISHDSVFDFSNVIKLVSKGLKKNNLHLNTKKTKTIDIESENLRYLGISIKRTGISISSYDKNILHRYKNNMKLNNREKNKAIYLEHIDGRIKDEL